MALEPLVSQSQIIVTGNIFKVFKFWFTALRLESKSFRHWRECELDMSCL